MPRPLLAHLAHTSAHAPTGLHTAKQWANSFDLNKTPIKMRLASANRTFRNPMLYPFELRARAKKVPNALI